jgi:hypothetical protein
MQDFALQKKTEVPLQEDVMSFSVTLKNKPLPAHLRPPASNNAAVSLVELRVEPGSLLVIVRRGRQRGVAHQSSLQQAPWRMVAW